MESPQLILNAAPNVLAIQIESWRHIVAISKQIAELAERDDWTDILSLAEVRDNRVEAFFKNGVCSEILPQVSEDLENIKMQHRAIMTQLAQRQIKNIEDESSLKKAKDDIYLSIDFDPVEGPSEESEAALNQPGPNEIRPDKS